jgi:hypothetical protein
MTRPHYHLLNPSPLTTLRQKQGLTIERTAEMTGYSALQIARIEAHSQTIPRARWRGIVLAVTTPAEPAQPTLFDFEHIARIQAQAPSVTDDV